MKNYVQPGDFLTFQTLAGAKSGDLVVVESLVGVAALTVGKNETLTIATQGVFDLPKLEADEIKFGMPVRADKGKITVVAASGVAAGIAVEDAGTGTKTVKVKLT